MDFTSATVAELATMPLFHDEAVQVVDAVRQIDDLATFFKTSQKVADKAKQAYDYWGEITKSGIYAYDGDAYKGFYAATLTATDIAWAQQHIAIASGVYGLLRPLDAISAYRLEMKAPLSVLGTKNLYEFWSDKVSAYVDKQAAGVVCVLASEEYAKVVTSRTQCRIVTPVFVDKKPNGTIGTVPIYSKMMRGVMARWIIDHRIDDPMQLTAFSAHEYAYNADLSTDNRPVYSRNHMRPLQF